MRAWLSPVAVLCVGLVTVAIAARPAALHRYGGGIWTAAPAMLRNAEADPTAGPPSEDSTPSADTPGDAEPSAGTFHGYSCAADCADLVAGYSWGEEHGIVDADNCPIDPHYSRSFTEGCWASAGRDGTDN